jgi:hypothetical protein
MFTHMSAARSAKPRSQAHSNHSFRRACIALLLAGLLAGCMAARTAPVAMADPADPSSSVRAARYSSVLSGYVSQRPVSPKPWREQNERVTPKGGAQ